MKKKRTLILLLQFLLVIGSIAGIVFYMNSQTETSEVFVYTKNFNDSDIVITESDIKTVSVPTVAVSDGFAVSKEDILGKYVMSGIKSGQYVYTEHLTSAEEKDVFETLDLAKYRKISLPIDMVEGLSGNIRRGDKVDLVFTGKAQKEADDLYASGEFTYSNTFLQNVLVYSVNTTDGYEFEGYADITEEERVDENGEPVKSSKLGIITLAVTLTQAEEIYARRNVGNISFVGRFGESQDFESTGYAIGDYSPVFSGEASIEESNIDIFRGNTPAETPTAPIVTVEQPTGEE